MKKFKTSFSGYSKDEVNQFVATVSKEYESMLNKLKAQDEELIGLRRSLEKYQNIEATLNKTILIAEDTSNQMKKLAREESKGIIDDAKRNASRIVNDALLKAEKMESDAEALRRQVINFKRKFRQAVEQELEAVEEIAEKF